MTGEEGRTEPQEASVRPLVITGLALAALVIVLVVWVWAASFQRQDVAVSLSGPPQCTGTELAWRRVSDGHRVPAMRLQESMQCRTHLRVFNQGNWAVRITHVVLPLMGRHAGGAFQVERLNGIRPVFDNAVDGMDAVFPVDRRLAAGQRYEVPIDFTFRPGGCTAGRSLVWFEQMPQVTVSAMGRPGTVSGHQIIAFQGTKASDNCSSPPVRAIGPSKQTAS